MKFSALVIAMLLVSFVSSGQENGPYEEHQFISGSDTLNYRLLYPENFDPSEKYPVILFLHGAGERGSDNQKQLVHGSRMFLQPVVRNAFPAIILFPQCPKNNYWANVSIDRSGPGPISMDFSGEKPATTPLKLVQGLLDSVINKPFSDRSRIYAMGLSMGGMGTFEIVARNPDLFAAAVPICGGGNPEDAVRYATKTPMWIFHGALDNVVSPDNSTKMALAIQRAGGSPALTIFPYANHNSWDPAFAYPDLLPWLFAQHK